MYPDKNPERVKFIDLMIVVAVIVLVISIIAPNIRLMHKNFLSSRPSQNLKSMDSAVEQYVTDTPAPGH